MKTKHTPGPWRYEESTKTIRAVHSNYWLVTMDSWDGAINNEANAQLIASAPELLEALKLLIKNHEDIGIVNVTLDERIIAISKQAIAKAEGK